MPVSIGFAFLAGIFTIAAPCILPMLPIILGASIGQRSRLRPVMIVLGFVLTFSLVTLIFSAVTRLLGLSALDLRYLAAGLIGIFGVVMIWPRPFEAMTSRLSTLLPRQAASEGQGHMGALLLGAGLGLVWAPCAGPVLASILVFVATSPDWTTAGTLLLAYSLGAGIPMLLIAYGGQYASQRVRSISRHTGLIQRLFGVVVIATAVLIGTGYDAQLIAGLSRFYPQGRVGL